MSVQKFKSATGTASQALDVYCADIGSVSKQKFGWAVAAHGVRRTKEGKDVRELVASVVGSLNAGRKVALGFECPLFVPLAEEPENLTRARVGDRNRAWSAAAGASALATGLAQVTWILSEVRKATREALPSFLGWKDFTRSPRGLFLWEAFVSGKAKGGSHPEDAAVAVNHFLQSLPNLQRFNAVKEKKVISLVGAALLRSEWDHDLELLSTPCIVIRPDLP